MAKNFVFAEDLLDDEGFRDWYLKKNTAASREFANWLESNSQNKMLLDETIELTNSIYMAEENVSEPQLQAARQRLFEAIGKTEAELAPVVPMKKNRMRNYWVAAAAVLLIASAATWYLLSGKTNNGINTAYGQIAESNLPDGSLVTLNANSSVTLSDGWDKDKDREVWLKGEAFFKVKKKENKQKFIVHTDQFDIIVTGTQFNVVNRTDKTAILLHEGSVILKSKDGNEVYMKPGDYFEFAGNKNEIEKKDVKEVNVLAWKDKKLVFEDTPLSELATILNRHYGVNVIIADDELKSKPITGILPNDNLEVLMQALEATMDFKIQRKANDLVIAKP